MSWFSRKRKQNEAYEDRERAVSVEIQHHKDETAKVIAQTKKVTDNFNRVLNRNGITIKIHVAAGGKH